MIHRQVLLHPQLYSLEINLISINQLSHFGSNLASIWIFKDGYFYFS